MAGSSASASSASSIETAPTWRRGRGCRRRSAWLTPAPQPSMSVETCCSPVPEAPISPMSPRRTSLAKPSGTPPMIAVPQSGPMTSNPRSCASRLSADLLLERHVVAEHEHAHAEPQRLACLRRGVGAGGRDDRQVRRRPGPRAHAAGAARRRGRAAARRAGSAPRRRRRRRRRRSIVGIDGDRRSLAPAAAASSASRPAAPSTSLLDAVAMTRLALPRRERPRARRRPA